MDFPPFTLLCVADCCVQPACHNLLCLDSYRADVRPSYWTCILICLPDTTFHRAVSVCRGVVASVRRIIITSQDDDNSDVEDCSRFVAQTSA